MSTFMPFPRSAVVGIAAMAFFFALSTPVLTAHGQAPAASPPTFVSVGDRPAILFDSPSQKGVKQFIVARATPLEVLVRIGGWTKVRDADGTIGWIENSAVGMKRYVSISSPTAQIRTMPNANAPVVTEAERGVLFEVTSKADGWLGVTHRDGQSGYVSVAQVFGG
jgi:SH3-like domain-containing protein